ncbi:MAG: DUF1007 family protein [Deltaproteobacteria bacterium]|nr:DUF1007 family protein [Deltaproteobacteria bacterium]
MKATTGKERRSLWGLGPVARSCLALAVLLLIFVAIAPSQATACPACARYECVVHVHLNGLTTKERFEGFEVIWAYSKKYSTKIIKTYDRDGDQTLSTKELAEAQAALWAEVENNQFCLIMVTGGEPVALQGSRRPVMRLREGIIILSFEILVGQPISEESRFRFYFSDPGGKIKFTIIEPLFQAASGPWRLDYEMNWSELVSITFSPSEAPGPGPVETRTSETAGRIHQELISWLKSLLGMDHISLEPASDGQAELMALNLISAHLEDRKAGARTILVANNSYFRGEKAALGLGFRVERLDFGPDCCLRVPDLGGRSDIAALFLSNPNCFGLWEEEIDKIVSAVHAAGGLVVNHARNISGFLTYWIPGEAGIDAILFPLGGVFGVPHFGGGPSVTGVGFTRPLADHLPGPETAGWPGQLRSFGPNWPIILRAYLFLGLLGWEGLKRATEDTVLAANYLQERCRLNLAIPEGRCLNQFTATVPDFLKETEIRAVDIARRLLDDGVHGPAVDGLPALKGRLSFEPTEGCTHKILNQLAESIGTITIEVNRNFPLVRWAPHTTPIAQPKIEEAREEMIVVFTPGVIHSDDIGCGCPSCVK